MVCRFEGAGQAGQLFSLRLSACAQSPTLEQPLYVLDRAQKNVLALSNLNPETCRPSGNDLTHELNGVIVARQFDKLGMVVNGVTIEGADGERTYANVAVDPNSMNMVTKSWVIRGLQTLLKEGNRVSLGIKLCGMAGRVVMIDSVRLPGQNQPH